MDENNQNQEPVRDELNEARVTLEKELTNDNFIAYLTQLEKSYDKEFLAEKEEIVNKFIISFIKTK